MVLLVKAVGNRILVLKFIPSKSILAGIEAAYCGIQLEGVDEGCIQFIESNIVEIFFRNSQLGFPY